MKKSILKIGVFCLTLIGTVAFAKSADHRNKKVEDKVETTTEEYVSRNPFTKTTTETTLQKNTARIKDKSGIIKTEETLIVEKQRSDDGKKAKVKTEETYTEEQE